MFPHCNQSQYGKGLDTWNTGWKTLEINEFYYVLWYRLYKQENLTVCWIVPSSTARVDEKGFVSLSILGSESLTQTLSYLPLWNEKWVSSLFRLSSLEFSLNALSRSGSDLWYGLRYVCDITCKYASFRRCYSALKSNLLQTEMKI